MTTYNAKESPIPANTLVEPERLNPQRLLVAVCVKQRYGAHSPSCGGRGANNLIPELKQRLAVAGVAVRVEASYCLGYCLMGPNVRLIPGGRLFHGVTHEKLDEIVAETAAFVARLAPPTAEPVAALLNNE